MKILQSMLAFVAVLILISAGAIAQSKEIRGAKKTSDRAAKTLDQIMRAPDNAIPEALLNDAKAIAVFPNVRKVAFGIGGSGGNGIITRRTSQGWGAPAVFNVGGGSFGLQIGASSTDYVMLFMTDDSLRSLLQDRFEIGGEASIAAGPVGRTAKASTDAQLKAAILSYSRSKGLFAGVSLSGAVIYPDNDANLALYNMKANELLTGENKVPIASIPAAVRSFHQAVARHSR